MIRFLLTLAIAGAIVFAILHYSGFDLVGRMGGGHAHVASRGMGSGSSQFFATNVIAGIVSGLIVAVIQGVFSRR